MQSDLTYITSGLFTRFYPNTRAGEAAWKEMAQQTGCAAVLSIHAKGVIGQLRAAGYSVGKQKQAKPVTAQEIEKILEELES